MALRKPGGAQVARIVGALGLVPLLLFAGIFIGSFFVSVPEPLQRAPRASRYVWDRGGLLLARTRGEGDDWYRPVERDELGRHFVPALLAAEDARYYSHPGIDPVAIGRALVTSLLRGRIVSGASTLTQQLARAYEPGWPKLARKFWEMSLALRLERVYRKDELLELYVNHVHFGPKVLGLRAAAERYFGKEPVELELSEAATLAGLVRGPALYDLERRPELARKRRDRVLARLQRLGSHEPAAVARALAMPLTLHMRPPFLGAPHWVRAILRQSGAQATELRTTLDLSLQRELERIARGHVLRIRSFDASALSIVVVDNQSSEVLAYVGSPDFSAEREQGQVDGAGALRQPGSALKPFLYAAAVDQLGLSSESELLDEPVNFAGADGYWAPQNYDGKFRGPVTLRRALANSLNVPAVQVLSRLGLERGLDVLRGFGFRSLTEPAHHYGPALALGAGEVSLLELTAGYSALARDGSFRALRLLRDAPAGQAQVACTPAAAREISDILADSAARREVFGAVNDFDFPFWVATKTGTSKGYRDAWTMGFTGALTVGVWVGNFDGRPMRLGTGAGSAGPIFHEAMTRAVAHLERLRPGSSRAVVEPPVARRAVADLASVSSLAPPQLLFPKAGMVFRATNPLGRPAEVRLRATQMGPQGSFWVGQQELHAGRDGTALWSLSRGEYEIFAQNEAGLRSAPVRVRVEQ